MHPYNPSSPRPVHLTHRTDDVKFRIQVADFVLRTWKCISGRTPAGLIRALYEDACGDTEVFAYDDPEEVKTYAKRIFDLGGFQADPVFFSVLVLCSLPKTEDVKLDVIRNMFKTVNGLEMDEGSPQLAAWALGFPTQASPTVDQGQGSWDESDPLKTTSENVKKQVRLTVRWAANLLEEKSKLSKQIVTLYEKVENREPLSDQDRRTLLRGSKIGPSKFMALLFLSTRGRVLSSTVVRNFYEQMYNIEVKTKTIFLLARFSGAACPSKVVRVFSAQAPKTDLSWGVKMGTITKHADAAQKFLESSENRARFILAATQPGDDLDGVFHRKPIMFAFVAAKLLAPALSQNEIRRFYLRLTGSLFNTNFLNLVTWYSKHKMA